jgi:hypothetical protein
MKIWRLLHEQLMYPYNLQKVQGLKPADCPARETLYLWFVMQCVEPPFILSVLFSDGAGFGRNDIRNFQIHHQWIWDNPHGLL